MHVRPVVSVQSVMPYCVIMLKKDLVSLASYRAASRTRAETQRHEEFRVHRVWLQVHQTGTEALSNSDITVKV